MFNVTIQQKDLMQALKELEFTVGKNNQNLGDNCLSMVSDITGEILFYTTNTIEFSKLKVIANSMVKGTAPLIDFKRFKGIIASIDPSEFIHLEQDNKTNDLLISFNMRKPIRLSACASSILPYSSVNATYSISIQTSILEEIVESAVNIIVDSLSAPLYNCIRISTDQGNVTAEAIDITNKRTMFYTGINTTNNPQISILIEANKFKKIMSNFIDYDYVEFHVDPNTNVLEAVGSSPKQNTSPFDFSYCSRNLSGIFPDVKKYYHNLPTEIITVSKEDVINSLSRIKAIGESNSFKSGIQLIVNNNQVEIHFKSLYGEIQDPVDVLNTSISHANFIGCFFPDSLEEIIKGIKENEIQISQFPYNLNSFVISGKSSAIKYTLTGIVNNNSAVNPKTQQNTVDSNKQAKNQQTESNEKEVAATKETSISATEDAKSIE